MKSIALLAFLFSAQAFATTTNYQCVFQVNSRDWVLEFNVNDSGAIEVTSVDFWKPERSTLPVPAFIGNDAEEGQPAEYKLYFGLEDSIPESSVVDYELDVPYNFAQYNSFSTSVRASEVVGRNDRYYSYKMDNGLCAKK